MMGVNTRNMYSCLQKCNKLNKSHLVGQLLNSIHDARTHVYITIIIIIYLVKPISKSAIKKNTRMSIESKLDPTDLTKINSF